jgi:DNA-binding transcriptional LysR family regulator
MDRLGEPLNEWEFHIKKKHQTIKVSPALSSNDGAIIRDWALAGRGIAYKSVWDVQRNIKTGQLQTVLDDFVLGFQTSDTEKTGLQLVYPNRKYLPSQVAGFIEFFKTNLIKMN